MCSESLLLSMLGVSIGSVLIAGDGLNLLVGVRLGVRLSLWTRERSAGGGDGILAREEILGLKVALEGGFVEYMLALEEYCLCSNSRTELEFVLC